MFNVSGIVKKLNGKYVCSFEFKGEQFVGDISPRYGRYISSVMAGEKQLPVDVCLELRDTEGTDKRTGEAKVFEKVCFCTFDTGDYVCSVILAEEDRVFLKYLMK